MIDGLGAYITAEDIGTTTADMDLMARHSEFVVGRSLGCGAAAILADHCRDGLPGHAAGARGGHRVRRSRGATRGPGGPRKVGSALAAKHAQAGADVIVCDLDHGRCERFVDDRAAGSRPPPRRFSARRSTSWLHAPREG